MGRYLAGVATGVGLVVGALAWLGYTAAEEDANRPIAPEAGEDGGTLHGM